MEENKNHDLIAKVVLMMGTLLGYLFINKKLKERNLRFPTIGEYLVLAFVFSLAAWILIFVVAMVVKIVTLISGLF